MTASSRRRWRATCDDGELATTVRRVSLQLSQAVYEELGKYGDLENQVLCRKRVEELQPSIRYCLHKLGESNLQTSELMHIGEMEGPALDLFKAKLESIGADVNQKLFRGFATTAAVREGHLEILEILVKAGASQPACEEALLEASCHGRARLAELLMGSDLIRPHVAVHALVTVCCRGFKDVVDALIKCGVDTNASDRVLLQSYRPSLHTNVDCNALIAAVVSRQISVVCLLLQEILHFLELGNWVLVVCCSDSCCCR